MNDPMSGSALDLFDHLLELPDAERAERLRDLRARDPALAAEVEALLRADAARSGVLDQGVEVIVAQVVQPPAASPTPRRLGAFDLLRRIGEGGMGEVWLAERDSGGFRQQVALKRLRGGRDSEDLRRRFVQERRILAELSHPYIARFIDGGVDDAGAPWYAMEYVQGTNIVDYARDRALDVRERVALLADVAEAVVYAQNRLVVHRDLKPSNILIDAQGRPRLLDFGIAKLLEADGLDPGETATGLRAMSPAYAAPEQILGETISTATDVYALGVVLYQLLTDSLPHERASSSLESLIDAVRAESTERPSARLRRTTGVEVNTTDAQRARVARQIRGDLDTIVMMALRREPDRRYPAVAAFAEDLRRWLDGRPITAQPDTRRYRLRKFIARHRLLVAGGTVATLALIIGAGLALWQARVAREQARLAQAESARAEAALLASTEAGDRTRRVKEFLMRTFIAADPMNRPDGAEQTVSQAFDEALQRIDTEVADDPKLQVDLLDDFSEIRGNQGRFDEASVLVNRALALAEKLYPPDSPVIAESLLNQGAIAAAMGNTLQALPAAERAVAILAKHEQDTPLQYAAALNALLVMRDSQGRPEEALALSNQALAIIRAHYDPSTDQLVAALSNHSNILLSLGRHAEAEPFAREAVKEAERLWGPNAPRLSDVLNGLQMIVYRLGHYDEAAEIAQRRVRLVRELFGDRHPLTAAALSDLASIEQDMGQTDLAREHFDTAIDALYALDSEQLILALRQRALFRRDQKDNAGALADFEAGLEQCRKHKPGHVICQVLRANRAGHLARMGRGEEALREADIVIAELERDDQIHDNEYPQALEARAFALHALGRVDEAKTTQQRAIASYAALFGDDHEEAKRARRNLAKLDEPPPTK